MKINIKTKEEGEAAVTRLMEILEGKAQPTPDEQRRLVKLKNIIDGLTSSRKEICNECGKSVSRNSGRLINRVLDCNDQQTRREMCKPFPLGDYICSSCDDFDYVRRK